MNDIDAIERRHVEHGGTVKDEKGRHVRACSHCGFPWPCDARKLLDIIRGACV